MTAATGVAAPSAEQRAVGAVLAVDLGGTRMRAAVVAADGTVVERVVLPTPRDQPCARALLTMIRALPGGRGLQRAVVGVPGRVDHADGSLEHAPNLPPGWVLDLRSSSMSVELGMEVAIANDADLAAVGEHSFGAGRGARDMVYVTYSTGVGAGVVLGGRLLRGRRSLVEVGHTIVDVGAADGLGTAEATASGTALARRAAGLGFAGDAKAVLASVSTDPAAAEAWRSTEAAVLATTVNLSHLFCPDRIVIGGGLGLHAPGLVGAAAEHVRLRGPRGLPAPVQVVTAELGDDAGLAGAAAWSSVAR